VIKAFLLAIAFASPAFADLPCNVVDIQSAVTAAMPGDTIAVAAGSSHAVTPVTMGKSIDLRIDPGCTIIDDYTAGDLFTLTEPLVGEIRISGGSFLAGLGPVGGIPYHISRWLYTEGGKPIVWTDSNFNLGFGANAFGVATNRGVIARNTFTGSLSGNICSNNASALRLKPIALGNAWMKPYLWGTADINQDQALFFETNTLTNVFEGVDVDDNGISVVRHNTFTNSGFLHHGVDTGWDGGRASEIYRNKLKTDASPQCAPDMPAGTNSMVYVRGGTIRLWENEIDDIRSQWWGDKAEVTFTTEELRRPTGRFPCTKTYPAFHQSGWGWLVGAVAVGGQTQDLEPSYIWGNTGAGNYNTPAIVDYAPNQCGDAAPSAIDFIKMGREVILGPAPNYTPSPYPHRRANVAPTPAPPSAPSNLRVISVQ
jgi:hypothetical protein